MRKRETFSIRLVDVFDRSWTACTYTDVVMVYNGEIYFADGDVETFDTRYYDYEVIK